MNRYAEAIRSTELVRRIGKVVRLSGLVVESVGPDCAVGDICELVSKRGGPSVKAEVVVVIDIPTDPVTCNLDVGAAEEPIPTSPVR